MDLAGTVSSALRDLSPIWLAVAIVLATRFVARTLLRTWGWVRADLGAEGWRTFGAWFRLHPIEIIATTTAAAVAVGAIGVRLQVALAKPVCAIEAKSCTAPAASGPSAAIAGAVDTIAAIVSGAVTWVATLVALPFEALARWCCDGAGGIVATFASRLVEAWPMSVALAAGLLWCVPDWLATRRRLRWLEHGRRADERPAAGRTGG